MTARSCAHPPPSNRELWREFWRWTCAHPARLGRLVFLVCWTLGLIVAGIHVVSEVVSVITP